MLSIEDNPIDQYASIDAISEFPQVRNLRLTGNPIMTAHERSREFIIARSQFLTQLNGTVFTENERRDCELFYLKQSFKDYLKDKSLVSISNLEDESLRAYMNELHPRWFQLVEKFGSPLDTVSIQKEGTNIQNSTAKVDLVSQVAETEGKVLTKKLLLTMTVAELKSVCSKLFKVEALRV